MAEEDTEYKFENTDEKDVTSDEEDEAAKAFRAKWIGVSNATAHSFMVQVNIDAVASGRVAGNE